MKDPAIFFTARRARCACGIEEKEEQRDQDVSKCLPAQEELNQARPWGPPLKGNMMRLPCLNWQCWGDLSGWQSRLLEVLTLSAQWKSKRAARWGLNQLNQRLKSSTKELDPKEGRQLCCSQRRRVLYIHRWHFKLPTLQSDGLIRLENCQCSEGLPSHLIKLKVKHSFLGLIQKWHRAWQYFPIQCRWKSMKLILPSHSFLF